MLHSEASAKVNLKIKKVNNKLDLFNELLLQTKDRHSSSLLMKNSSIVHEIDGHTNSPIEGDLLDKAPPMYLVHKSRKKAGNGTRQGYILLLLIHVSLRTISFSVYFTLQLSFL